MSGAIGRAPCGHDGEHVVGSYVRCLVGCDAIPQEVEDETTSKICRCEHQATYQTISGRLVCLDCMEYIR